MEFKALQYKKDIKIAESVQMRATKVMKGVEAMTYEEQLGIRGLFSLEKTRLRGAFIAVHNFLVRGNGEEVLISSLRYLLTGCKGMA